MNVDEFLKQLNISKADFKYIKKYLKREPNELELHLFSAMYSEHCAYRHSKKFLAKMPRKFSSNSTAAARASNLKVAAKASTKAVFYNENAGGIRIGEHSILFKTESHNHPSAVEPFNGAATGIGGIVRDVLAMNARPIALGDSLKFGTLEDNKTKHIFEGVVNGISAYGNCIGVPTLAGECDFDPAYTDNPLVNVLALGIAKTDEVVTSKAVSDSLIVLLGSPTMKDGIGGAAFASKDLNEEFEENRIAVQIADPLMEKKLIEATLEIMKLKLAEACQDCGAAGILSSTSEMAFKGKLGINLYLDKVHLAQKNMLPWEIMLSETQERMMFCVKKEKLEALEAVSVKYEIPYSVVGETIKDEAYRLFWGGELIADLPTALISDAPFVEVKAKKNKNQIAKPVKTQSLQELVSDPSFASKEWIYSQYDYTVGGRTVLPPREKGASAVWLHEENCFLGIAFESNPKAVEKSPYFGTIETVNAAARKLIASGFEPLAITNCLNFANPNNGETIWQFKESVRGMKHALKKLKIPVVSGNVSFYNESENFKVYPTPTIVMVGVCHYFEDIIGKDFSLGETVCYSEKMPKIKPDFRLSACLSVGKGGVLGALFKGLAQSQLGFNGELFEAETGFIFTTSAPEKLKKSHKVLGTVTEKDFIFGDAQISSVQLYEKYKNCIKVAIS